MEGVDWYTRCPQCLNVELNCRLASQMEIIKARLSNVLNF